MDLSALLPIIEQAVSLDRLRSGISSGHAPLLGVSDGARASAAPNNAAAATPRRSRRPSFPACGWEFPVNTLLHTHGTGIDDEAVTAAPPFPLIGDQRLHGGGALHRQLSG